MPTFKGYNSFEEMMADMRKAQQSADMAVQAWQTEMKEGDCFLRLDSEVPIFGQIVNPFEFYDKMRATGEMNEELEEEEQYERNNRANPKLKNYRFCKCYSIYCPEGELGDTHVSSMYVKLTMEQFSAAMANGWQIPEKEEKE